VRPVLIVVGLVLAEGPSQMGLVPDEGAVQEFTTASADPAFDDRVRAWRPRRVITMFPSSTMISAALDAWPRLSSTSQQIPGSRSGKAGEEPWTVILAQSPRPAKP
jgi:hypothetical protein